MEQVLKKLKAKQSAVILVAMAIWIAFSCFAGWLNENILPYEVEETKWVKVPYEYTYEVSRYICYITDHGDCYHEDGCQYLHSSVNQTTVEDALNGGYRACSKCDPPRTHPAIISETRYRYDKQTDITIQKRPYIAVLIWVVGSGLLLLVCYPLVQKMENEIDKLNTYITAINRAKKRG